MTAMATVRTAAIAMVFALASAGSALGEDSLGAARSSVVKITCRVRNAGSIGTGFAWPDATHIVTALHVVAGCTGIDVFSEGTEKSQSAKIERVLIDSDLALIKLEDTIDLTPLKTGKADLSNKEYMIWGYPLNVRKMQGDQLRFSRVLKPRSTLADLMDETAYGTSIGNGGYPRLTTTILRVGSTIQPGHSGSPIIDPSGTVVGIGDGGLHQGIRGINWAIPTAALESLAKSTDVAPATRPMMVAALYSMEVDQVEPSPIALAGKSKLNFAFSLSVQQLLASASADEAEDLKGILDDEQDTTLGESMLDIFSDPVTGATIAVPKGMTLKLDPGTQMATVTSPNGRVTMYTQVLKTGGAAAMKRFEARLDKLAAWKQDPDVADDRFEERGQLQIEKARYSGDSSDSPEQRMFYSVNLDGDSFLGTAIVATGNADEEHDFHLMEICVELAGFSID